ncbi:hypothetical protein WUBG_05327 [Wuchereria bancrofti]|uniref:Uncharacterized protein n=1 Tax=Wuchereria bancrofti TaxID=6293 RepID=J9EMM1_WUCBA|nr:hypothetical protein WUBG_05327 [Wuchereria bancrofti]
MVIGIFKHEIILVKVFKRFTTTDAPIILIIQLMIPLIIWQIILGMSFFPDDFVAQFLDDFYGNDDAAGDQAFNQPPPNVNDSIIHSHGDISITNAYIRHS